MPVTAASSRDVTAINVLMNSFVLACKWSIAIDKMDGRGHFNTARSERLPKRTKVTWY